MKRCRILLFAVSCCINLIKAQPSGIVKKGPVTLGITDTIQSVILNEQRVINISLPEGYSPDSSQTYPVIYLLDGGVEEDFFHIAGLVKYFTTPWVHRFPASIVVGIENVNRRRDFTFATPNLDFLDRLKFSRSSFPDPGGSARFISFIESELQPYIQSHYKANNIRTIIGESLGGLLASEILLKKPQLFDNYIIVSPSLWWGNESLLKEKPALAKDPVAVNLKIYIGTPLKTEDTMMYREAVNLLALLKKYKKPSSSLVFDYLPGETHATVIHPAVFNAFKLLYPVKKE